MMVTHAQVYRITNQNTKNLIAIFTQIWLWTACTNVTYNKIVPKEFFNLASGLIHCFLCFLLVLSWETFRHISWEITVLEQFKSFFCYTVARDIRTLHFQYTSLNILIYHIEKPLLAYNLTCQAQYLLHGQLSVYRKMISIFRRINYILLYIVDCLSTDQSLCNVFRGHARQSFNEWAWNWPYELFRAYHGKSIAIFDGKRNIPKRCLSYEYIIVLQNEVCCMYYCSLAYIEQ